MNEVVAFAIRVLICAMIISPFAAAVGMAIVDRYFDKRDQKSAEGLKNLAEIMKNLRDSRDTSSG